MEFEVIGIPGRREEFADTRVGFVPTDAVAKDVQSHHQALMAGVDGERAPMSRAK